MSASTFAADVGFIVRESHSIDPLKNPLSATRSFQFTVAQNPTQQQWKSAVQDIYVLPLIINFLISQLNITFLFTYDLPPMMTFNHVNHYY